MSTEIKCPECGKSMETGFDSIARDYYAQCQNRRCNFDGWFAETIEKLAEIIKT